MYINTIPVFFLPQQNLARKLTEMWKKKGKQSADFLTQHTKSGGTTLKMGHRLPTRDPEIAPHSTNQCSMLRVSRMKPRKETIERKTEEDEPGILRMRGKTNEPGASYLKCER